MTTEAPVSHYIMESTPVKLTTSEIIHTWPPRLPYHIILWSQHLSNSQHQRLYIHDHRGSRITLYYGVNTCQTHNIRDYTYMTTEAPVSHYIMESTPVKLTTSEIIHTWPPRLPYHITLWSQHLSNSQHQRLYIHNHWGSRITLYYGVNTCQTHTIRDYTYMTTEAPVSHYIMDSTPVNCTTLEIIQTWPPRLPYHITLWSQHLSNSQHQRLYKHDHRGSRITLYYGVNTCQTQNIRDYTYMTTEAPVSHYIMESTPVKLTTSESIQTWPPRLPYHIILWSQHLSNSQHQRLYKHDHRGSRITLYYGVNTCQTHNIRDYTYMTTEAPVSHYIMESTPVKLTTSESIQTWPLRLPYHITLWSQHLSNSQHQRLYIHDHWGPRITLHYGVNTCQTHNIRDYTYMTTEAPVSHYIMESTPVKLTTSESIQTWPPRLPYHIILWSQHLLNSQHQRLYIHDHRGSRITLYYGVNTCQTHNIREYTNMTTEAPVSHYIMESAPVKRTTSESIQTWPPRLPYHIILWSQHLSNSQHQRLYKHDHRGSRITLYYGVNTCQTHNIRDYTNMTIEAPVSHYIMESTPVKLTTSEIIHTWPPRLPYHIILWSQHQSSSQHQRLYIHDHRGSRIPLYYGVNTSQLHSLRNHTNMTRSPRITLYYIWCGVRTISLAKSVTWYTEYLMYFFHCEETRPLVSIFTYIDAMFLFLRILTLCY